MTPKDEKTIYDSLTKLPDTGVPASGETFSLEEILAEYGGSRHQKILHEVERASAPSPAGGEAPSPETAPPLPEAPPPREFSGVQPPDPETLERALPESPRPISMEEVVGSTVDAVMEEQEEEPLVPPRRGLFSRKKLSDTETLYQRPEQPPEEPERSEAETIGPEPDLTDEAEAARRLSVRSGRHLPAALLGTEAAGVTIPYWTGEARFQAMVLLAILLVSSILSASVFARAFRALGRRHCTGELLISLSAVVTMADCVSRLVLPDRSDVPPYAAACCAGLVFALWGGTRLGRGWYDTYRAAAMDDPPYLITDIPRGACKQRGRTKGFYTCANRDDVSCRWQNALLPVVLAASFVFAGLATFGSQRNPHNFLLNWSAILTAGASFALPLTFALPFARLSRRLQKDGCAVAGYDGAERINRGKCLILTDADLFPPGTITLNGMKTYGEELGKVASYAATLARASGCGLQRLFEGLLRSEGGAYEELTEFSFYEEGGFSGTIHGETAILGTASFMRKMEVRLPGNLKLHTGVYLAVDRQLAAVFAVKYQTSENVDWALRLLKRNRITPVLAARDPNVTPTLVKRKFSKGVKVEFPSLSDRVALSELESGEGLPRALLYREGLLPYADAAVGGRRLCGAVRRSTFLAMLGSISGTLLTFYLTFQSAYALLTPLSLLVFLLLWTLPVLLLTDWTGRF